MNKRNKVNNDDHIRQRNERVLGEAVGRYIASANKKNVQSQDKNKKQNHLTTFKSKNYSYNSNTDVNMNFQNQHGNGISNNFDVGKNKSDHYQHQQKLLGKGIIKCDSADNVFEKSHYNFFDQKSLLRDRNSGNRLKGVINESSVSMISFSQNGRKKEELSNRHKVYDHTTIPHLEEQSNSPGGNCALSSRSSLPYYIEKETDFSFFTQTNDHESSSRSKAIADERLSKMARRQGKTKFVFSFNDDLAKSSGAGHRNYLKPNPILPSPTSILPISPTSSFARFEKKPLPDNKHDLFKNREVASQCNSSLEVQLPEISPLIKQEQNTFKKNTHDPKGSSKAVFKRTPSTAPFEFSSDCSSANPFNGVDDDILSIVRSVPDHNVDASERPKSRGSTESANKFQGDSIKKKDHGKSKSHKQSSSNLSSQHFVPRTVDEIDHHYGAKGHFKVINNSSKENHSNEPRPVQSQIEKSKRDSKESSLKYARTPNELETIYGEQNVLETQRKSESSKLNEEKSSRKQVLLLDPSQNTVQTSASIRGDAFSGNKKYPNVSYGGVTSKSNNGKEGALGNKLSYTNDGLVFLLDPRQKKSPTPLVETDLCDVKIASNKNNGMMPQFEEQTLMVNSNQNERRKRIEKTRSGLTQLGEHVENAIYHKNTNLYYDSNNQVSKATAMNSTIIHGSATKNQSIRKSLNKNEDPNRIDDTEIQSEHTMKESKQLQRPKIATKSESDENPSNATKLNCVAVKCLKDPKTANTKGLTVHPKNVTCNEKSDPGIVLSRPNKIDPNFKSKINKQNGIRSLAEQNMDLSLNNCATSNREALLKKSSSLAKKIKKHPAIAFWESKSAQLSDVSSSKEYLFDARSDARIKFDDEMSITSLSIADRIKAFGFKQANVTKKSNSSKQIKDNSSKEIPEDKVHERDGSDINIRSKKSSQEPSFCDNVDHTSSDYGNMTKNTITTEELELLHDVVTNSDFTERKQECNHKDIKRMGLNESRAIESEKDNQPILKVDNNTNSNKGNCQERSIFETVEVNEGKAMIKDDPKISYGQNKLQNKELDSNDCFGKTRLADESKKLNDAVDVATKEHRTENSSLPRDETGHPQKNSIPVSLKESSIFLQIDPTDLSSKDKLKVHSVSVDSIASQPRPGSSFFNTLNSSRKSDSAATNRRDSPMPEIQVDCLKHRLQNAMDSHKEDSNQGGGLGAFEIQAEAIIKSKIPSANMNNKEHGKNVKLPVNEKSLENIIEISSVCTDLSSLTTPSCLDSLCGSSFDDADAGEDREGDEESDSSSSEEMQHKTNKEHHRYDDNLSQASESATPLIQSSLTLGMKSNVDEAAAFVSSPSTFDLIEALHEANSSKKVNSELLKDDATAERIASKFVLEPEHTKTQLLPKGQKDTFHANNGNDALSQKNKGSIDDEENQFLGVYDETNASYTFSKDHDGERKINNCSWDMGVITKSSLTCNVTDNDKEIIEADAFNHNEIDLSLFNHMFSENNENFVTHEHLDDLVLEDYERIRSLNVEKIPTRVISKGYLLNRLKKLTKAGQTVKRSQDIFKLEYDVESKPMLSVESGVIMSSNVDPHINSDSSKMGTSRKQRRMQSYKSKKRLSSSKRGAENSNVNKNENHIHSKSGIQDQKINVESIRSTKYESLTVKDEIAMRGRSKLIDRMRKVSRLGAKTVVESDSSITAKPEHSSRESNSLRLENEFMFEKDYRSNFRRSRSTSSAKRIDGKQLRRSKSLMRVGK